MAKLGHTYSVYVDDNFHYQDEGARYKLGDFATLGDAVAACKKVVDEFLTTDNGANGAAERYERYTGFGPDPFIMTDDQNAGKPPFSAWNYARERCGAGEQ
jgi:hypothetical protein